MTPIPPPTNTDTSKRYQSWWPSPNGPSKYNWEKKRDLRVAHECGSDYVKCLVLVCSQLTTCSRYVLVLRKVVQFSLELLVVASSSW